MIALEEQGLQVELFPLIIQNQAVTHPESRPWLQKLHRTRFLSFKCFSANLLMFIRKPLKYFFTFNQMIWLNIKSPKFLIRALFIFPVAVKMSREIEALGISHVHAHYATHPALAAWIVSRFTNIPYSITVHAHDIFVNRTMLKQKLQDASFVRAISGYNKKFLCEKYGDWLADKINVIHCGINPDMYESTAKKDRKVFQIISVGSLQEYKGHEYLVKACNLLKEKKVPFKCVIVGGGERQRFLFELINALALQKEVILAGSKTEEEVAAYLSRADCFVLPSIITGTGKMEGIPVVLMEALASKLPVIASEISGIPELIEDNQTGLLVSPQSPDMLAEKIIWMIEHPVESEEMAQAGYQKVLEEFNLKRVLSIY